MNKKRLTIVIISVVSLILISGIVFISVSYARGASSSEDASSDGVVSTAPDSDKNGRDSDYTYIPPTEVKDNPKPVDTATPTEEPFVPATEMDLDPSSITVFVNKEYALSKDYKPDDLVIPNVYFDLTYYDERTMLRSEAAAALERLFLAADNAGYKLCGVSGFRSYQRQKKIFTENILTKGKVHTLQYSAVPGTSEHQTGLAMDLSCETLNYDLSDAFADTPEGKWLADNAYRFGYIIRYPKGKGDITGYAYEPWHIRYVGKGLAKYLYDNDLTLDEYYHYTPSKDFNFEALYADLINITPIPSGFPIDGDGIILGENGEIIEGELGDKVDPTDNSKDNSKGKGATTSPTPVAMPTPTLAPVDNSGDNTDGSNSDPSNDGTGTDDTQSGNGTTPDGATPTVTPTPAMWDGNTTVTPDPNAVQ
ncbi:MAG TPA: M15 family metallopeptidase [Mobilitalea sp.]|nr:M15 family metallopeptidase [Mobilitalea sp.]